MTLRRFAFAAASLSVAACSSGSGSSPVAAADLESKYAAAVCQKFESCCPGTPGAPSEGACETSVKGFLDSAFGPNFADAKVSYSASVAGDCLSEINAAPCGFLVGSGIPQAPSCSHVFTGTIANGSACLGASPTECQSGLCGNEVSDANGVETGTCVAQVAAGGSCPSGSYSGSLCADGSYDNSSGANCACAAALGNGAACGANGDCTSGYCLSNVCTAAPSSLSTNACSQISSLY